MDQRLELDLDLDSDGHGGFRVTVRSAAGEAAGELRLDPGPLLARRDQLQTTVLASAVTSRGIVGEFEAPVREVGEALFHALFDDEVYAAYKASLALTAAQGNQLRVVLRTQQPELAALPWEMMYDPEAGAYLCQREPLVRHIGASIFVQPLEVEPPLRVLGVVSAPRDRQQLDVEGEKQRLRDALSPLGSRVLLKWVAGGRWAEVQQELIAESWHVLHFVGHGGFRAGEGALVLENAQGGSDLVGAKRFSDLLSLQQTPLRMVVLNSCAGGQSAADDPFSSSAATLIRSGVSAVVAMQFAVSDPAAMAFSAGFYQAIAHNRTVAEAVRIGRIGIRGIGEHTLEWVTPVVYLRGDDATLFDVLPSPPAEQAQELSPEDAALEAAALALYQDAAARLEAGEYADAVALFDRLLEGRDDYHDAVRLRARAVRGEQEERRRRLEDEEAEERRRREEEQRVRDEEQRLREEERPRRRRTLLAYVGAPVAAVLLAGGVWLAWPDGDPGGDGPTPPGEVPAPFQSSALYDLARHHFEPGDCHPPRNEEEAAFAQTLPHVELLKCYRDDQGYRGALLCAANPDDFDEARRGFLSFAEGDPQQITSAPAGRDTPWPFQQAYVHEGGGFSRVLFDDESSGCMVELQEIADTDIESAVDDYTSGLGS